MLEVRAKLRGELKDVKSSPYVELNASLDREVICQEIVSEIKRVESSLNNTRRSFGFGTVLFCAYVCYATSALFAWCMAFYTLDLWE